MSLGQKKEIAEAVFHIQYGPTQLSVLWANREQFFFQLVHGHQGWISLLLEPSVYKTSEGKKIHNLLIYIHIIFYNRGFKKLKGNITTEVPFSS